VGKSRGLIHPQILPILFIGYSQGDKERIKLDNSLKTLRMRGVKAGKSFA
jgi:hypothetical protein